MGGAGNGTGKGPFVISYACIVHNPTVDADDRYPNASLWSTTLPVNGLIFENEVNINAVYYDDAVAAAAAAQNRDTTQSNSKEDSSNSNVNDVSDQDKKPAAKRAFKDITKIFTKS